MTAADPDLERFLQKVVWGVPLPAKNPPPLNPYVWKDKGCSPSTS